MFWYALLSLPTAQAETFSERHGKKVDTETFSGRHSKGVSEGVSPDEKTAWHMAGFGEGPLDDMRCRAMVGLEKHRECTRPEATEDRVIGTLSAEAVRYRYWEGELYEVLVDIPEADAAEIVLRALRARYGPADLDGPLPAWRGSVLHIDTRPFGQGLQLAYTATATRDDLLTTMGEVGADAAVKAALDL